MVPQDFINILKKHGTVFVYTEDWQGYQFKKQTNMFMKTARSFKISEARVIELRGARLGLKTAYAGEFTEHSLLKRGRSWKDFSPSPLPVVSCVKDAKRSDVFALLQQMGAPDVVMQYYRDILSVEPAAESDQSDSDQDD